MAVVRNGSQVKTKLGFLIYGSYGCWKSSLLLQFMKFKNENGRPFRVLYIDTEGGSIDSYLEQYENEGIDLRNIYMVYTQSLTEVQEFIRKAKDNEDFYIYDEDGNETDEVYLDADGLPFRPDAIVIDSITVLYIAKQQSLLEFSKKRATVKASKAELTGLAKEVAIDGASIEIKDYQTLKFIGQSLILDLLACGKHFGVSAREDFEKENFKDKNGEIKSMATGKTIPSGFKDLSYNVKTVLHTFKDEDGIIKAIVENKDRTLVHKQDEILIEPTLLDWQVVIDRNKGKKNFTIANTLNKSIDIEVKAMEKENAKYDSEDKENILQDMFNTSMTVEEYHIAIANAIKKLNQTEKSKVQTAIVEAGYPKAYQKIDDPDILKKYLSIVNSK